MRRWLLVLLIPLELLAAPTNRQLTIGLTQEFENLNPIISQMLATVYVNKLVVRALMVLNPEGTAFEPQLAVRIPTFENRQARFIGQGASRKIESDWEIKPQAVWGDGAPITGHDVKFSWRLAQSPNVSVGEKEAYSQVEEIHVDAKSPKSFRMIHKSIWDFNHLGSFYIVPVHLEKEPFEKYENEKEGYGKNSLYTKNPTHKGLSSGPYLISEMKLGSHVTLVRNPRWWGHPPQIETITIKLIPISSALESNLRSGTIEMISPLGLSFDEALAFEKRVGVEKLPYNVNYKPSLTYEHVDLNLRNPLLRDVRVRKALLYGINRDELVNGLFEERQHKANHWISPNDPWYTEDTSKIVVYQPSRRRARKLLEEAGWIKAADGYRYKNGQKLSFLLMTTAGHKLRELVQVYLQNEWRHIGVEVLIKNEPARVFFGETIRKGLFPAMALFAWITAPEVSPRSILHSSSIPSQKNGFSGQNATGRNHQKVDETLDQLDQEFDGAKRLELISRLLHAYTDEVPVLPLYHRSEVTVTPKNLKGYKLPGHQFSETNWAEYWSLE